MRIWHKLKISYKTLNYNHAKNRENARVLALPLFETPSVQNGNEWGFADCPHVNVEDVTFSGREKEAVFAAR